MISEMQSLALTIVTVACIHACNALSASCDKRQEELKRYNANWESLDSRPLPAWYDNAKFGIFVHWGVFSVPAYGSEWFWHNWHVGMPDYEKFMQDNYPPKFTYPDFAPSFTAAFYDPSKWVSLFQDAGAKYVVLTTKHHEGYCNFQTKYSWNWNSLDIGPKRDLVGEFSAAVRHAGLNLGLYYSLFEWYNPLWVQDAYHLFLTQNYVNSVSQPQLHELVEQYRPDLIWSDGYGGPDVYWLSQEFLAWLYNDSPVNQTIVVNDRWGFFCPCKHGGFLTCTDSYTPSVAPDRKWECATSMFSSWGYARNKQLADYSSSAQLVASLIRTVALGGNFLLNIGPTSDGIIEPAFEQRLREIGAWLAVHGDGIYGSKIWHKQADIVTYENGHNATWYYTFAPTSKNVYAFFTDYPPVQQSYSALFLSSVTATQSSTVTLVGSSLKLSFKAADKGTVVFFPLIPFQQLPSKLAWSLCITSAVFK